jgi:hypothetical protein
MLIGFRIQRSDSGLCQWRELLYKAEEKIGIQRDRITSAGPERYVAHAPSLFKTANSCPVHGWRSDSKTRTTARPGVRLHSDV